MRKTILALLVASFAVSTYAHPVSLNEAKSIASDFFNSGSGPKRAPKNVQMTWSNSNSQDAQPYYIFNADGDNGFVIVAGDTRSKKILGYSDKGSFNKDKIPPQLEWLLSEYQKSIESIPTDAPTPRQRLTRSSEQNYLLTTQWGQGEPYNAKCPFINGGRAVTGCVATAMAQIINYENKTSHVAEIPEYWCAEYMPTLPAYEFDYGHLDNEGIATLMLYCGQSVRMDYGPVESGAAPQDVPEALRNYFGWEPEVRTLERDKYNDEHWNRMVKEEISKGHPLLYSAVGEQGWHAFVVDGIVDDLFHVNWGWDGYLDGFYSFQPFAQDHKSDYIKMQWMVAVREDDPSADIITYGTTIDGINYELMDDLTAVVLPLKDGNKYRGDLVIPSHVNFEGKSYTVNYFGPNAFVNCSHLESIFIPSTIVGQEWSIFEGCENLHKVNVEDMVAFIKLPSSGWPESSPLNYGADLYLNNELVKDLVIPEGIESIGYCKFRNCWSIESVTMSSTMKEAGQYSFANCPKLKCIDMSGSSLEILGGMAFVNSESLEEVIIPASVKTLKYKTLGKENGPGCEKLRKIVSLATTPPWSTDDEIFQELHHSDAVLYVPDDVIEDYRQTKEWCKFLDIRPLSQEMPLPETVDMSADGLEYEINISEKYAKLIGKAEPALLSSRNIIPSATRSSDGYVIPYSVNYSGTDYPVEAIGYNALYGLQISEIEAPLSKIGMSSFGLVSFDEEFELPAAIESIPNKAFIWAKIPYLILPENITSIGHQAFESYNENHRVDAIECRNPQPPSIFEDSFDSLTYEQAPLKVPYGSLKAYLSAAGWRNFKNICNIGEIQEHVYNNDLTFSASIPNNIPVKDNMHIKIAGNVRNSGLNKATGFILAWYIDNKHLGDKRFDQELNPEDIFSFEEKITANFDNVGTHDLKLIVTMIGAEDQEFSDNTVNLSFESFDKGYYRVSLFEQFTTETCSFTTHYAPQIANGIKSSGQSDFLAQVTHHCGFFDDFLTLNHDYEWFYNDNGATYTPALMINRTDLYETGYTPVSGVPDDLDRKLIKQAGICNALVSVYCEVNDNKVIVKTLLEKNEDFDLTDGFNRVTVFLLEDSIPSREQLDTWSDGYAEDYIHRNTVRKVLSGIWGDKIEWNSDRCAYKYESEIDGSWNSGNLKAVAFIHRYDPTSPINCQVYTANSSDLSQYGTAVEDSEYKKPKIDANSIVLNQEEVELRVGESIILTATVLPEEAEDKTLTWISNDESIVTVDKDGKLTGISLGEATITAICGDATATCKVTVVPTPVESIELSNSSLNLTEGDTATLTAIVGPEDATDKTVTWTSSDESVATVSSEGVVTAVKAGSATITATTSNGLTASCIVTVEQKIIEIEAIILNAEELYLEIGDTYQLNAEIIPADATYQDLEWQVDDESVATITNAGLLTVVGEGVAIVYVRSLYSPDIEASCTLNATSEVAGIGAENAKCDIYDIDGKLLRKDMESKDFQNLDKGIYIMVQGQRRIKAIKR